MSKEILQALVQLFAIFAKQDTGVSKDERNAVYSFLKQTLNKEDTEYYLNEFDKFSGEQKETHVKRKSLVSDSTKTLRICAQINKELTQIQKVIVVIKTLEIISAGGKQMTDAENDFISTTVDIFGISKDEFNLLKNFILSNKIYDIDDENVLLIDSLPLNDKEKSKHIVKSDIDGVIAILHIPSVELYMLKYNGTQELLLNGNAIRAYKPYILVNGSAIRGNKINSIYFSDIVTEFRKESIDEKISFIVKNLQFKFANGKIGLRNINLSEEGGHLVGFMGASGAGKSTLLNVLNGNETPSEGSVELNGINIHEFPEKAKGTVGYVPQDDLLIESLTVFENLYYAAKLCFKDKSEKELKGLVNSTIADLGLNEIKRLKVGSVLDKTISGGQRKRLNIGLELLREPPILFVDEPTSGLSSRDSENIMDLLKEIALAGKLVFVVIHQPSSDIFKQFDRLLILDNGGYPIFYGNPIDSVIYFKNRTNQINADEGECFHCGNINPEQVFNLIETKVVNEYGNHTEKRKISPEEWHEMYKEKIRLPAVQPVIEELRSSLQTPSMFGQMKVFITRDILSKIRNKQYLIINFLEAPFLAFVLGFIVRFYNASEGNNSYVFSKNENLSAYIFMAVIVALFMGLTISAEEIINDRKILQREKFLNLSWLGYLFSKVSVLFFISLFQTLTFVLVGNFILGIKGMYLSYWIMLFAVSALANLMGLNISSAFKSVVTIYILIPILLIPQLILSGIVVNFDRLNPAVSNEKYVPLIGDVMASRWAFEALAVRQVKDNLYSSMFYEYNRKMGQYEYEKVYHIPHLEKDLDYCIKHLNSQDKLYLHNLELLRSEVAKISTQISGAEFKSIDKITPKDFDINTANELREFLLKTKKFYVLSYNDISEKKDEYLKELEQAGVKLSHIKDLYYNEHLEDLCKNTAEETRIFESKGELIQKIYPIYQTPSTQNSLNYRTQFLFPEKNLLGNIIDVFWFNFIVIWTMSIALFLALYYKWLEKLLKLFEKNH